MRELGVIEVKGKNVVKGKVETPMSEPSPGSLSGETKTVELRFCKDCKGYDKSREREFHRKVGPKNDKGERTEIVEIRAVCENPKSTSYHHLVMAEYSKRQCEVWEQGTYVKPTKEKKAEPKKEQPIEQKEQPSVQKPQRKKHIKPTPNIATATNILNNDTKVLETRRNGKVYVTA